MNNATADDLDGCSEFRALAALPMADGGMAAEELGRCVERFGFAGGAIPTQVGGRDLDRAGLEPLWEAAETLGVLLFIHPHRVMGGDRVKAHFLGNVCGNPFETTLAALRLYFADVFTKWPKLKILLAHGGGPCPTWRDGRSMLLTTLPDSKRVSITRTRYSGASITTPCSTIHGRWPS